MGQVLAVVECLEHVLEMTPADLAQAVRRSPLLLGADLDAHLLPLFIFLQVGCCRRCAAAARGGQPLPLLIAAAVTPCCWPRQLLAEAAAAAAAAARLLLLLLAEAAAAAAARLLPGSAPRLAAPPGSVGPCPPLPTPSAHPTPPPPPQHCLTHPSLPLLLSLPPTGPGAVHPAAARRAVPAPLPPSALRPGAAGGGARVLGGQGLHSGPVCGAALHSPRGQLAMGHKTSVWSIPSEIILL